MALEDAALQFKLVAQSIIKVTRIDNTAGLRITESNRKRLKLAERAAFQNGSKDIAILTDACSVGMSLHCVPNWVPATRGFVARQRVHITMEVPWSGEKAVQQLGDYFQGCII